MTDTPSRPLARIAACVLAGFWASRSVAQDAVLQLANLTPAAGSITSTAPGLSCAAACSGALTLDETVTLTAVSGPGCAFDAWSGDCAGMTPTCTLVMDRTKLAIASFKAEGDPLTVIHRFTSGSADGAFPSGALVEAEGALYGVTSAGGRFGAGTIFREQPDGSLHTVIHEFLGGPADGSNPQGSLIEVGGVLYGMTPTGGPGGTGTVFRFNPDGGGYAVLRSFAGGASDGAGPIGSLVESGGLLYGTTSRGGVADGGTVFAITPDGSGFAFLHAFTGVPADGMYPSGGLVEASGALFGLTRAGGIGSYGTIYRMRPDGSGFAVVRSFGENYTDGSGPSGSLIVVGGVLYGTTQLGGGLGALEGDGTVFEITPDGGGYAVLHAFGGSGGSGPSGPLLASGGLLYGTTSGGGDNEMGTIFAITPDGGGFALLHSFAGDGAEGGTPGPLIASGAELVGTTGKGGSPGGGTVFAVDPRGGGLAVLHSFGAGLNEPATPTAALFEVEGAIYGAVSHGGAARAGAIFRINPDGSDFTLLYSFDAAVTRDAPDYNVLFGPLVESGGVLYGVRTFSWWTWNYTIFQGEIFRVNLDGSGFAVVHSFANPTDPSDYPVALLASGGVLYGSTAGGTLFKVNPDGSGFASIHPFGHAESGISSLLESGGVLYGTATSGGKSGLGTVFSVHMDGSGFATLHAFIAGSNDGAHPTALVTLDGALYGTTSYGGSGSCGDEVVGGCGTVFRLNPDGSGFAVLHSFTGRLGDFSLGPGSLVAGGDGALVGFTARGGAADLGTVFRIATDGSGFALVHSFSGADGCALIAAGEALSGATGSGGIGDAGVLFRIDPQPRRFRRHAQRN
jgi:uncharacterized repeat protein (TIGR03803 family)